MQKNILSDNAAEAWSLAKKLSNQIRNGLASFQYRKLFVACLHNATELYIKAAMIDQNDLRLLEPRKIAANGSPAQEYYSTTDLNAFITGEINTNPKAFSSNYHSCEYHNLRDYHKELFKNYYDSNPGVKETVCDALRLLEDLRNNETHFSVNPYGFLTESEYVQLHNFMIEFYKILKHYNLFPFFGEPFSDYRMRFEYAFSPLDAHSFSFKKALISSNTAQEIAQDMVNLPCAMGTNAFEIADEIVMHNTGIYGKPPVSAKVRDYDHLDEVVVYIQEMFEYNLVEIVTEETKYSTELCEGASLRSWYEFKCWNLR